MKTEEKQKMFETVIQKAWDDPDFKAQLIANPVNTLKKSLGRTVQLPQNKTIKFVDQSDPNTLFINIPEKPEIDDMELDENQLDAVAGGGERPKDILNPPK